MSEERVPYIAGPQKPEEERIAFIQWNKKNDICPAPTELQCGGAKSCDECKVGMTRTEAIEKMAKAICRRENLLDSCSHCMFYYKKQNGEMCKEILTKREDDMEPSYIDIAEAALDALLEKGK